MASGRFADYLGKGLAADRPATPVLHPEMPGLWLSTDSGEWSAWDGTAWIEDIMGGGGAVAWGSITGTLSSQTDLQTALDAKAADRRAVTALSIASGVVNIDCSLGDYFTLALTANVTSITFSNLPGSGKGASIAIRLQQDATGSRTVALPASFKAITGSDTAVQSAANARTILMISTFDNGTRWEYSMKAGAA